MAVHLSKYQPYRETNHRTAYTTVQGFLRENGFENLTQDNDEGLAEILAEDRDPWLPYEEQVEALTAVFAGRRGKGT